MRAQLEALLEGREIGADGARTAMESVFSGEATQAQIAALLIALRAKGETTEEIAGCAQAMRAHAVAVRPRHAELLDIVGTGGDGTDSFNVSTSAALVAAAAGARVAKHGNRAASSKTGTADVLEELGVVIDLPPGASAEMIDRVGFGFLFARTHHPAMRHAAAVRAELGVRTVLNLLGPLCNPVNPPFQVIGVPRPDLVGVFADVVQGLGTSRTLIVHGAAGHDELTTIGVNELVIVEGVTQRHLYLDPHELGFAPAAPEDLRGGDSVENAAILRAILDGESGPRRDTVLLNAAAGLYACGRAPDFTTGIAQAAKAIDSGAASELLRRVVERTRGLAKETKGAKG